MCDGRSWPSWTIISARSVSQTSMPLGRSASLSSISWVAIDLTLTTSLGAVRRGRSTRRSRSPRRRRAPSGRCRRPRSRRASSCSSSAGRSRRTSSLIAAPASAQLLPVGALGDDRGALRRGSSRSPGRGSRGAGRRRARPRAASGNGGVPAKVGSGRVRRAVGGPARSAPVTRRRPVAARISARCMTRTGDRRRDSSPPMCIRHDVSPAVQHLGAGAQHVVDLVEAHRDRRVGVLDRERAAEPAALLGIAAGRPASSPRPRRAAGSGRSPTPSRRIEWQVGWKATVCGKRAPTSVTPEHVDEELGQLVGPAATTSATRSRQACVAASPPARRRAGGGAGPSRRTTPTA